MIIETGIDIMGGHNAQAVAVPLMKKHSPHLLDIFPAHITLLYPWVPVDALEAGCEKLRELAAEIAPFEVTMQGYGQFPGTTFMSPRDPAPTLAMFEKLSAAFPDYPPYRGQFGDGLHPHMTVAEFEDVAEQERADFPDYGTLSFTVDRLHVIHGPSKLEGPWLTYDVVRLTG